MNIYFKKLLSIFVLTGLFYSSVVSFNESSELIYSVTYFARIPASIAALRNHRELNEKDEANLKVLESFFSLVNESLQPFALQHELSLLNATWMVFEVFRLIKYVKKYNQLNEKEKSEDSQEALDDIFYGDLEEQGHLDEKRKGFLLEKLVSEFDAIKDVGLNDSSDLSNDENKPVEMAFKFKCAICLFLIFQESILGFFEENVDLQNLKFASRGLRYFLLSESGSVEAKCSLILFVACLFPPLRRLFYNVTREPMERFNKIIMNEEQLRQNEERIRELENIINRSGLDGEINNNEINRRLTQLRGEMDSNVTNPYLTQHGIELNTISQTLQQHLSDLLKDQEDINLLKNKIDTSRSVGNKSDEDFQNVLSGGDVLDCPICRYDFENGNDVIMPSCDCNTICHEDCFIKSAVVRSHNDDDLFSSRCPWCRTDNIKIGGRFKFLKH